MKRQNVVTLDYVLKTNSFLMVDSNAFIFHYPLEIHQKLNEAQFPIEKKKNGRSLMKSKFVNFIRNGIDFFCVIRIFV